jgi:hypothetical protein
MLRKKLALLLLTVSPAIFAQDSTRIENRPATEFVKKTFENGVVINNQTIEGPSKHCLDFMIQHRFGQIMNGKDLFGIFGPANIRLGLGYGITKRLSIGIGATKNNHLYDLEWKYAILKQANNGGMPVTVTYYGNATIAAGDNANFINQENKYTAANRTYFFHELMFARKFNTHFSLQLAGSYTYLNYVANKDMKHSYIGVHTVACYRINVMSSFQVEYDMNLGPDKVPDALDATKTVTYQKPNLSLGYEMSTGQHQFQIFVTTANGIAGPEIISNNTNDFTKKNNLLIGFNITRQFE